MKGKGKGAQTYYEYVRTRHLVVEVGLEQRRQHARDGLELGPQDALLHVPHHGLQQAHQLCCGVEMGSGWGGVGPNELEVEG